MTDRAEIEAAIEAVLFVASEPVPKERLMELFGVKTTADLIGIEAERRLSAASTGNGVSSMHRHAPRLVAPRT